MFYLPIIMLFSHLTFPARSLAGMIETGYEWWTTPIMVPCSTYIVCIRHYGFHWKTIKYPTIKKLVFSSFSSNHSLSVILQNGKAIELSTGGGYCMRELKKMADVILHNICVLPGIDMKRTQVGHQCVVWSREDEGDGPQAAEKA